MSQTRSLLGISLELFEAITENLVSADLANLRLASRETSDKVERTFLNRTFGCVGVMISDVEAITEVIRLTKYPKFGSAIKTIEIFLNDFTEDAENTGNPAWEATRSRLETRQRKALRDGVIGPLLVTLFSHLRRTATVNTVRFVDLHYANSSPLLCKDCRGQDMLKEAPPAKWFLDWYIDHALEALCVSGLRFEELVLLHSGLCMVHSIGASRMGLKYLIELLPKITGLQLSVAMHGPQTTSYGRRGKLSASAGRALDAIATNATKLQNLSIFDVSRRQREGPLQVRVPRLQLERPSQENLLRALEEADTGLHIQRLFSQPLPPLKELTLHGGRIDVADLIKVLKNQSGVQLKLFAYRIIDSEDIMFYDPGVLAEFLKETLGVESVYVCAETIREYEAQAEAKASLRMLGTWLDEREQQEE